MKLTGKRINLEALDIGSVDIVDNYHRVLQTVLYGSVENICPPLLLIIIIVKLSEYFFANKRELKS